MSVTIKDVAKVAGVSHTTVSRALRGHPAVSAATTENIRTLANEMGYIPNSAARGLKTNRSGVMGVIVRRIDDPFFSQVVDGLEDTLQSHGYSVFLAISHQNFAKEKEIFQMMSERRVDGVILCSTLITPEYQEQLNGFGIPIVLINNEAATPGATAIMHDDTDGARQVANHLLELGHREIAYLGNTNLKRTNHDRLLGYQQALTDAGIVIRPELIIGLNSGRPAAGAEGVRRLLELSAKPSAIMCYNDMMAFGAMFTLQALGMRVPGDFSVTGFDNIELSAHVNPSLTTFDQPKYELGQTGAQMMVQLIEKNTNHQAPQTIRLEGKIKVRHSTAPRQQ